MLGSVASYKHLFSSIIDATLFLFLYFVPLFMFCWLISLALIASTVLKFFYIVLYEISSHYFNVLTLRDLLRRRPTFLWFLHDCSQTFKYSFWTRMIANTLSCLPWLHVFVRDVFQRCSNEVSWSVLQSVAHCSFILTVAYGSGVVLLLPLLSWIAASSQKSPVLLDCFL